MIEKERITITLTSTVLRNIDSARDLTPRSTYIEAIITGKKGVVNEE